MRRTILKQPLRNWFRGASASSIRRRYGRRAIHIWQKKSRRPFSSFSRARPGQFRTKPILTGWLFKTTRFAALAQMRAAAKRSLRTATIEKEFQMQNEFQSAATDDIWNQMSPLLDEALAALGETDRQAVLLRFFDNKSLAEVGKSLGMGEDTARKRVSRALEKLRRIFQARREFDDGHHCRDDFRQFRSSRAGGAGKICDRRGDCQRRDGQRFNLNPHQRSIENYGMD